LKDIVAQIKQVRSKVKVILCPVLEEFGLCTEDEPLEIQDPSEKPIEFN
jgi:hypothetical protein